MRQLYATDASEYHELPLGVAFPTSEADLRELVLYAHQLQYAWGLISGAARAPRLRDRSSAMASWSILAVI